MSGVNGDTQLVVFAAKIMWSTSMCRKVLRSCTSRLEPIPPLFVCWSLIVNNVVNVVDVLTQIFANICGKEK